MFCYTQAKVYLNLDDDIFTVNRKIEEAIQKVQVLEEDNSMDNFMHKLLAVPFLCRGAVGAIKLLDKYFAIPFSLVDVSPFHTSLFVTNLASIRTDTIYHHLYEFGTTSVFISMGKPVKKTFIDDEGKPYEKKIMELGIVTDERIANGHYLGRCFRELNKYLKNPEILEEKPAEIKWDTDVKKPINKNWRTK